MPTISEHPDAAVDPLADLRRRFVDRSRLRIAALDAALADDEPSVETIAPLAHQLAGSAGTFGYAALSRAAATLEDAVRCAGAAHARIDPNPLRPLMLALAKAFAETDTVLSQRPANGTTAPR